MSREAAKEQYTRKPDDPTRGFVSAADAQTAIDIMYDDLEVVGSDRIATDAVTSAKIADGTVTGTDIASGTITSSNIADGTIVNGDISASADIGRTKIAGTALTTGSTSIVSVADHGAVGDGVADDTAAIQAALTAAKNRTLLFESGKTYKVTSGIQVALDEGETIALEGNGATLTFTADVSGITKMLEITDNSTTNLTGTTVSVRGLTFIGSGIAEQWSETVYADLKQLWALTVRADAVALDDLVFQEFYGYGIKLRSFQDATITDIRTFKVGGSWYVNDTYDAFGDSIYVGGGKQDGNRVVVNNAKLVGYPDDRPRNSRAGLVFETNIQTVEVDSVWIEGYNRNIHIENCPDVVARINSVQSRRGDIHMYVHTGYRKIRIHDWDVEAESVGTFGGLAGLVGFNTIADTQRFFEVSNGNFLIGGSANFATNFVDERVSFVDCNFVADGGRQQINGGYTVMKGCRFVGKVLYFYSGELEVMGGVAIGQGTAGSTASPVIELQYASSRGRLIWTGGAMKDSRVHLVNVPFALFQDFVAIETLNLQYSSTCSFISDSGSLVFVKDGVLKTSSNDAAKLSFADSRTVYLGGNRQVLTANTASVLPLKTATLVAGTVTVSDTRTTANSVIRAWHRTLGGTPGALFVSAKSAGASFTITSTSASDTSVVAYEIVAY